MDDNIGKAFKDFRKSLAEDNAEKVPHQFQVDST
jgi:hypothetical protein